MSEEHHGDTIKLKKSTLWKAGTVVFGVLFLISLFTGGFGFKSGSSGGDSIRVDPTQQPTIPTGIANVRADDFVDDDPVLGDENAPLTIIEFSDFQCPFCKRANDDALAQVKAQYINTGKVKLVYRDFPLTSIHPLAQKAAEAAECADDQGKFWEYHDKIFEEQALLSLSSMKQWAGTLGLDTNKFNGCLDSGEKASEVANDLKDAAAAGGRGTPYFIIGDQTLSGAQPFAAFQAAIESQL